MFSVGRKLAGVGWISGALCSLSLAHIDRMLVPGDRSHLGRSLYSCIVRVLSGVVWPRLSTVFIDFYFFACISNCAHACVASV